MSNIQSNVNNTPLAKMSKKKQKEYFSSHRGSWGQISPVTRKPQNPKAYNRKKSVRQFLKDTTSGLFLDLVMLEAMREYRATIKMYRF